MTQDIWAMSNLIIREYFARDKLKEASHESRLTTRYALSASAAKSSSSNSTSAGVSSNTTARANRSATSSTFWYAAKPHRNHLFAVLCGYVRLQCYGFDRHAIAEILEAERGEAKILSPPIGVVTGGFSERSEENR